MKLRPYWLAGLCTAAFVVLFVHALVQLTRIDAEFRSEFGESNLWIVTQAEREGQAVLLAIDRYGQDTTFDDILVRLDILYSRIALMSVEPQLGYLDRLGLGSQLERAQSGMAALDAALADTDAPADLAGVTPILREMNQALREITNGTFLHERSARFERRQVQAQNMTLLLVSGGGIFVIGLMIAGMMWRNLNRAQAAQAQLERHRAALEATIAARTAELREALNVERRANEVYQSFIVTVSHQFRTPVSIIHMIAQRQLRGDDLPPRLRPKLQRIFDAAERLERLLSGFLASASSHKSDEIARHALDMKQVVTSAIGQMRLVARDRTLEVDMSPEPIPIEGDAILLEQVILNLLTNAVKYSDPPHPISVHARGEGGRALVSVADRGVGVPEAAGQAIFDRFFRAENVHNRQGAGVGLSFSREAIALHGGEITFRSRDGGGTEFTVALPLSGGKRAAGQPSDDPLHRGRDPLAGGDGRRA